MSNRFMLQLTQYVMSLLKADKFGGFKIEYSTTDGKLLLYKDQTVAVPVDVLENDTVFSGDATFLKDFVNAPMVKINFHRLDIEAPGIISLEIVEIGGKAYIKTVDLELFDYFCGMLE